ncbi:LIM domain and RING finger protein [Tetrabaena socialis]|uniref:LIM domain and RING finger protein n=1 Tax=Tetrabaena socialis TaxID=47790 RepID=A0A2J8AJQ7_9CHLO|nr:LIM domain and RING finger protein [Tetrabaena socialis]|eukprot:PNH12741.1 LIM domain and RING finger protein [Tetrabaena socialis]
MATPRWSFVLTFVLVQHTAALPQRDNLVMYIFAPTDPEFLRNLEYFVREAIQGDTRSDYVIVVQESTDMRVVTLPKLPRHARYVRHTNRCYDWGSFGWLLLTGRVDPRRYRYFLFINCSVRGPFLPTYARGRIHWTHPFTSRLVGDVRMVGPTISCEGSPLNGDFRGKWRHNPHVQSYVVATDLVGLQVLIDDGRVFHCHNTRWTTIYYSELGSSTAILKAGYNLDCLMAKYQGVDWRNKTNWGCNGRSSPQSELTYDGVSLDPHEVMFVKVKEALLQRNISYALKAARYDVWQERGPSDMAVVTANAYGLDEFSYKASRILVMKARGEGCFDADFYRAGNTDLRGITSDAAAWKHYTFYGQFERRPYRSCVASRWWSKAGAIGVCGHNEVCSKCVARMRFVLKDRGCVFCRQENTQVVFTRFMGDYTSRLAPEDFDKLQARVASRELFALPEVEGFFDDEAHLQTIRALCGFTHPVLAAAGRSAPKFNDFTSLKRHIESTCSQFFCDICIKGRKIFLSEQLLYSKDALRRHQDTGDESGPLAESGFKGHPSCKFCRTRFFDSSELYRHMEGSHEHCFLCRRAAPDKYVYYRHYKELEGGCAAAVSLGLLSLVAELISLCPDASKRRLLLGVHRAFICSPAAQDPGLVGAGWMPPEAAVAKANRVAQHSSWGCQRCGLSNAPDDASCEACGGSRPAEEQQPAHFSAASAAAAPAPGPSSYGGLQLSFGLRSAEAAEPASSRPGGSGSSRGPPTSAAPPAAPAAADFPSLPQGSGRGGVASGPDMGRADSGGLDEAFGGASAGGGGKGKKGKGSTFKIGLPATSAAGGAGGGGRTHPQNIWTQPKPKVGNQWSGPGGGKLAKMHGAVNDAWE